MVHCDVSAVTRLRPGNPEQRAVVLICHHQQRPVGRDDDIADAPVIAFEQALLGNEGTALISLHSRKQLEFQRCNEEIAVPFREHGAAIDGERAGRDRRVPILQRLLQPFLGGAFADLAPE